MKHIHFIGICGVGMSGLALAMQKSGYTVTGSDKGFYPPVSTYLKDAGVNYYAGWHPNKMIEHGEPDIVVVGNVASSTNPEWLYVQEHKLNYVSYPELIKQFFLKENSIVCAGTYGKTTTSSLLSWILKHALFEPSYMFGGLTMNDFPSAGMGNGNWSVLEGDEYKTARWDMKPKFSHYSPNHLLLTAVQWDHADIYPTEEEYFTAFRALVNGIPKNGLIVASESVKDIVRLSDCHVVKYGSDTNNDYVYSNIVQTKQGITFDLTHEGTTFAISTPMFGAFNVENIAGCFAMAHQIGIEPKIIIDSITSFTGLKRRLEKRFEGNLTIFDDIAHSPAKASSVLKTLKSIYNGKVIAIFEPNTGNRQQESKPSYANAFNDADEVIIPRLTSLKQDPTKPPHIDGQELAEIIHETHDNVHYIEEDEQLIQYILDNTDKDDVIVFLGSHGFRGMIEELIKCLQS